MTQQDPQQHPAQSLAQLILDTAEEGFCLFAADTQRVAAFNRQFAEFLNLDSDWLAQNPTAEEVAKAIYDRERHPPGHNLTGYLRRVLGRHQQPGDWEMELNLADGRTIVGKTSAAPTGERLYTAHDVTRNRHILHELESERQRLAGMVEHAPVAYYVIDCPSDTLVEMSRSIQHLTGYPADALQGSPAIWLDHIYQDDRQRVDAVRIPAIKKHEAFDIQYRIVHADGSLRWLREMAEIIPQPSTEENGQNSLTQMAGVLVEITRQKVAEANLRDGERRFRELIEGIPDLIFYEHDPDRRLTYLSPSVEQLIGYAPHEMIGKRFGEFSDDPPDQENHPDAAGDDADMQQAYRFVAEAIRTGRRQPRYEIRVRNRSGEPVVLDVHEYPVTDLAGVVTGFRGVARDITAMRLLERQLRERERLAILGTFAGGLAHDLNNLLLPIRASLETLERKPDPQTIEQRVSAIRQATNLAEDLVKKLLFWTRQDSSMASRAHIVNLTTWANNALTFFQESLADSERPTENAIQLNLEFNTPAEAVAIDPELLQQAILNLILNSKDAMPQGGQITLAITPSPDDWIDNLQVESEEDHHHPPKSKTPQPAVRFSVIDQGTGMPESVTDRAFDPFFSTKARGKSTGLGLALVRAIVQSATGSVHIKSERGQGTAIHIDIPQAQPERRSPTIDRQQTIGSAIIRIQDPMAAAFLASSLTQLSLETRIDLHNLPNLDDRLWVINPTQASPDEIQKALSDNPELTILALDDSTNHTAWPKTQILWHPGPIDLENLRNTLKNLIADSKN